MISVFCSQVRVKETMVLSLVLSSSGQHVQPHEQLLQLGVQTPAATEVPVILYDLLDLPIINKYRIISVNEVPLF